MVIFQNVCSFSWSQNDFSLNNSQQHILYAELFSSYVFFAIICLQTVSARVEFAQTQIYKRNHLRLSICPFLNSQADYEGKSWRK